VRLEFSRATRRDALQRSGQKCEAVGAEYGLRPGERCCAPLAKGVEFDHHLSAEMGGDNSLDNCRAVCIPCHRRKTAQDIRAIRKSDRQRDKFTGAYRRSGRPRPGSRASGWKRKVSGEVVRR
jgi:5-methylcytosine-specific restriction endonuclease McrA